ncbi:FkbM family methyltransferase [Halobellus clavatus]|uniref:Methyltransferase FkbM domain-containing protein n=1 Tax=Halobellus clavatus TaxID=660517 RepID=A0A1H3JQP0_9EURY|nr:FkbM family methyltransferase [Halobellus clavatus]SDY42252.1 Methyltransferase FkbM domain-containing protein [Halobellus clavatus]
MNHRLYELYNRVIGIVQEQGVVELFKQSTHHLHNHYVAPKLPRTTANYNGIKVQAARYFDPYLSWRNKDLPNYESGIVSGLEEHVRPGDRIAIVGGGWGVTAVKAAQETGSTGEVIVYEGSIQEVKHVEDTIKKNDVQNRVEVIHSIVGPHISLRGKPGEASQISPEELPECDVLELDCEGSEIEILENLFIRPRAIVVETHGINGAPSSKVEDLLKNLSYSITSKQIADKGNTEMCIENDIYVLAAVQE